MVTPRAEAGAWLQDPGTVYLRWSAGVLSTQERFDENGDRAPVDDAGGGVRHTRYSDISSFFYAEWGVSPRWNVVVGASWKHLQSEQPAAVFTTYGFGDAQVGLKWGLGRSGPWRTALQAMAGVPTGYDDAEYPALGSGVFDLALLGLLGASSGRFWGTGELGYVIRGGGFEDQAVGALGGGWGRGRLGLRGEARWAGSLSSRGTGTGGTSGTSGTSFDPTDVNSSNLDLAGTVSWQAVRGLAVEAEVRGTAMGENTLAGTRWSVALATSPAWRLHP